MQAKLGDLGGEYSYALYLAMGILPWTVFVTAVTQGVNGIVNNTNYIKKIPNPVYVYVFQAVIEQLFHLVTVFSLLFIFIFFYGIDFSFQWFLILIPISLLGMLILGISMILSPINVFFRDVERTVAITLQVLMWSIPIVYPISIIPESFQWIILYNPLYYYFDAIREILLYGHSLSVKYILIMGVTSFVMFFSGYKLIKKLDSDVRDGL